MDDLDFFIDIELISDDIEVHEVVTTEDELFNFIAQYIEPEYRTDKIGNESPKYLIVDTGADEFDYFITTDPNRIYTYVYNFIESCECTIYKFKTYKELWEYFREYLENIFGLGYFTKRHIYLTPN